MYSDTGMLAMNFVSFDVEIQVPKHIRKAGQSYMNTVERAISIFNMELLIDFLSIRHPGKIK